MPDAEGFERGVLDFITDDHATEHLAFAQRGLMENLGRHPRIEAADGKAERPITLQQAIGQRPRPGRRAGGFLRSIRELARIELGNVLAIHRAHLQAALGDDGEHAGFARRIAQREPRHLPVFLRSGRAAGHA